MVDTSDHFAELSAHYLAQPTCPLSRSLGKQFSRGSDRGRYTRIKPLKTLLIGFRGEPLCHEGSARNLLRAQIRITDSSNHGVFDCAGVVWVDQYGRVTCNLEHRSHIRGNNRRTANHAFKNWQAKSLVEGRKGDGNRSSDEVNQLRERGILELDNLGAGLVTWLPVRRRCLFEQPQFLVGFPHLRANDNERKSNP